jgi:tRNA-dihydrouridine synthase
VTIPVIANGDILDAASARRALEVSGAAGVMVGRGAQGAPWRPAQIAAEVYGTRAPDIPNGAALAALVAGHHTEMLAFYGRDLGLRIARKHLGWYADAAGADPALRSRMLTATTEAEVRALIDAAFTDAPGTPTREAA